MKSSEEKRDSGIALIGDVPWGTHFCQFYQTPQDLIDTLVPYFQQGLEHDEFCMWVTSEPLKVDGAKAALQRVVPDLDERIRGGQIEIIDYSDWYTATGRFDADRVLAGWVEKEAEALKRGYQGLRLTGNTFWLEKADWKSFSEYEAAVDSVIGSHRMLAVCTYSVDRCGAFEVIDVVNNHQFALIKRAGRWEVIESAHRKRTETALRESEERYQGLFEKMLDGFAFHKIVVDESGRPVDYVFLEINEAFERLTGLRRENVIGKTVTEVIPGIRESKFDWIGKYGKVALTGCELRFEQYAEPLGRWYSVSAYSPEYGYFVAVFEDITERKRAEEELRKSEGRYRALVELSPDAVAVHCEGQYVYINPAGVRLFGAQNAAAIIGREVLDLVHPDCRAVVRERMRQVEEQRVQTPLRESKILRLDGETVDVEAAATPVTYLGRPATQVVIRDITERKRAEESLARSKSAFEAIFNSITDAAVFADTQRRIVMVNPGVTKIFGYTSEELKGRSAEIFYTDKGSYEKTGKEVYLSNTKEEKRPFEIQYRRKDGSVFHAETLGTQVRDPQGNIIGFLGIHRDITARKRTEQALRESEERFRLSQEAAGVGTFDWNIQTGLNTWTPKLEAMYGLQPGDFARTQPAWENLVHPEDRAGAVRLVERAFETGAPTEGEWRVVWPDGSIHWLAGRWQVFKDESGKSLRMTGVNIDITERKRAEDALKKAHAELERRAYELDAVNRELESFSYTVSHDLKAPLRSIEGFTKALLEDYAERLDETGRDYLVRAHSASQRMSHLIEAMLNMARLTRGELQEKTVDLSALAKVTAHEIRKQAPGRQVEFIIQENVKAKGDQDMLQVMLENLLDNAWKFTSHHATAKIEFGTTNMDGKTLYFVRDDGAGFDMAFSDKLFKPFKRLHAASEFPGIGIGLAIAHRIVMRHNGRLWAESAPEKGATFYFTLA